MPLFLFRWKVFLKHLLFLICQLVLLHPTLAASLVFEITLHSSYSQQLALISNFSTYFQTNLSAFGGFEVREGSRGFRGFTNASTSDKSLLISVLQDLCS